MTRGRMLLPLPLLLALEIAAVVLLHRLGGVPGFGVRVAVAGAGPPEDAVMAASRLVALAVAWWLLGSTLLCAAAHACRLPAAVRAVEWAALPPVRRLVQRSLAASLSLSVAGMLLPAGHGPVSASASAAGGGPAAASVAPVAPAGGDTAAAAPPLPALRGGRVLPPMLAGSGTAATAPSGPLGREGLPRQHVVAGGEHLWGLARAVVAEVTDREPSAVPAAEVASYWVRLVEANPSSLRSGDPDVVFPGEVVTLPPLGR